uniref:Uncharacterized protein n=1 Tax=Knipowitschia caucasica TaxID=637954 RepID=A0AAV2IZQ1_KNICA
MSGAVQSGQRAAMEVLCELSPSSLSAEEREEVRQSYEPKDPPQPATPAGNTPLRAWATAAAVLGLTAAAVVLFQRPGAVDKVKLHFTSVFSALRVLA